MHGGDDLDDASTHLTRPTFEAVPRKSRWRPKDPLRFNNFPDLNDLLAHATFEDFYPLLPVDIFVIPKVRRNMGHRQRCRDLYNRNLFIAANKILCSLNSLNDGLRQCKARTKMSRVPQRPMSSSEEVPHQKLRARTLQQAAHVVKVRQDLTVSGAQAAAELIKAEAIDRYNVRMKAHPQVPIIAARMDEPPAGSRDV